MVAHGLLRWTGLSLATLASTLWVAVFVAGGLVGDEHAVEADVAEGVGVTVLALVNVVATAVAWHRPRLGGRLLVATGTCLAAFALLTAGRNHALAMASSGGPFLLAGVLLVLATRPASSAPRPTG